MTFCQIISSWVSQLDYVLVKLPILGETARVVFDTLVQRLWY